jgi:hypothetical protein
MLSGLASYCTNGLVGIWDYSHYWHACSRLFISKTAAVSHLINFMSIELTTFSTVNGWKSAPNLKWRNKKYSNKEKSPKNAFFKLL